MQRCNKYRIRLTIYQIYNFLHHEGLYYKDKIDPESVNILTVLSDVYMMLEKQYKRR